MEGSASYFVDLRSASKDTFLCFLLELFRRPVAVEFGPYEADEA